MPTKAQVKQQSSTKAVPYDKIEKLYYLCHDESIATFSGEVEAYDIEQFVVHEINAMGGYDAYLKSLYSNDEISMQTLIELSEPENVLNVLDVFSQNDKVIAHYNLYDLIHTNYIKPYQCDNADAPNVASKEAYEYHAAFDEIQSTVQQNSIKRMLEDFALLKCLNDSDKKNFALEAFVYKWMYSYEDKIVACRSYQLFLEQTIKASLKRLTDLKSLSAEIFGENVVKNLSQGEMIDRILNYNFDDIYMNDGDYNDSIFYVFNQHEIQHQDIVNDLKQYYLLKKLQAQPDRCTFNQVLHQHHEIFHQTLVQSRSQPDSEASQQKKQKLSEFIKETGLYLLGCAVMMPLTPIIHLGVSFYRAIKDGINFFNGPPSHHARKKKQAEFLHVAQQGVEIPASLIPYKPTRN